MGIQRNEINVTTTGPHYLDWEYQQYNLVNSAAGSNATVFYLPFANWTGLTPSGSDGYIVINDSKSGYINSSTGGPKIYPHPSDVASSYPITINGTIVANGGFPVGLGYYQLPRGYTVYRITYETFYAYTVQDSINGLEVQDEGSTITPYATSMNFVGSGVTAVASGQSVTVTIPGGGGSPTNYFVTLFVDQGGNDTAAAAAASAAIGGRIDVPFASVSGALSFLQANDLSNWTIWVFPGRYVEPHPWEFASSGTGGGNRFGTTIKLNGSCHITFDSTNITSDGSIRLWEVGSFSIIGDAPAQGLDSFGGARITTSHNLQIYPLIPSPQFYLGDGDLFNGGTNDGSTDEMFIKLHNIQFVNFGSNNGSSGWGGCNIVFGRHGAMDLEIDNCKFVTTDAVNMMGFPNYNNSGGSNPLVLAPKVKWYITNTKWYTQGAGTINYAYPNWELSRFRNITDRQRVFVHNSKFIVAGRSLYTGDSSGNSGHIITMSYGNTKKHWFMSWSSNVFYAPAQAVGNGAGLPGNPTWYMWNEMDTWALANYLDTLGTSISDNQIVGWGGGFGTTGGVFVDTMGSFAFSLLGNNTAGSTMVYDGII